MQAIIYFLTSNCVGIKCQYYATYPLKDGDREVATIFWAIHNPSGLHG